MRNRIALSLALAVALAGPAVAQQEPPRRPAVAPPAPEAADQTLGMALMSAFVDASGTLVYGSGAVSAEPDGEGAFHVYFNRSLVGCTHVVSISHANSSGVYFGIADSAAPANAEGTAVRVRTYWPTLSDPFSQPFSVIVFCPQ